MMKEGFANFSDTNLIVFGFLLFMAVFVGSFVWTYFIQDKQFYNKLSHMPLADGEINGK